MGERHAEGTTSAQHAIDLTQDTIEIFGSGKGVDTTSSGIEGAWTPTPITWDNSYFDTLFGWDWELTESPAGAKQWTPSNPQAQGIVPDAHDPSRRHAPMSFPRSGVSGFHGRGSATPCTPHRLRSAPRKRRAPPRTAPVIAER